MRSIASYKSSTKVSNVPIHSPSNWRPHNPSQIFHTTFRGGIDEGELTDVGDGGSHANLNTGVTLLGQLALEELVELGIEDTVGDELG